MSSAPARHHYVAVGGRLVHDVRAGRGPAAVLVHASPGDWRTLRPLITHLAEQCTVIALDTPGHGLSDPLPSPQPRIADYGAALVETMDALGLDSAHLYGTHTGAKIALSAAVARPDRILSLVLDGLGIATSDERADQLAHYAPQHSPRSDGGHLVEAWHQVRDMFRFWPWYAESAGNRLDGPEPDPAELHVLVHGMLLAGLRYPLAYRAAFGHDPLDELSRLAVPTLLLARRDDPLRAQLGRVGRLPHNVRLAPDSGAVTEQVAAHLAGRPGPTAHVRDGPLSATQARCFVPTAIGEVHVSVRAGTPTDELVVAPLGTYADDTAAGIVIELPGSGRSSLWPGARPTVDALADALAASCAALGVQPTAVRGCGATAAVTGEAARRLGARALVSGRPAPQTLCRLARLAPRADGTHLLAAWHLVRDAALRDLRADGRWPGASGEQPDLALLESRTVALTGCWETLPAVYAACLDSLGPSVHADDHGFPFWDPFTELRSGT